MKRLHPDSGTIDAIGIPTIKERFGISRQAVHYWRRAGVPNEHRTKLLALARRLNVDATSLKSTCGRKKGRPLTSGRVSASSASPA